MDDFYEGLPAAAEAIGASRSTISNWIARGRLPAQRGFGRGRGGGIYRIRKSDLAAAAIASDAFADGGRRLQKQVGGGETVRETGTARNGADDFESLEAAYIAAVCDRLEIPDGEESRREARYEIARDAIMKIRFGDDLQKLYAIARNRAQIVGRQGNLLGG